MALSPTDRGLKNCSGHYRQETLWLSGSWTGWGRSMRHLVTLIEELRQRGVNFRSLTDSIDTSTPMGRFFFHVMGALAEMERELIVERTMAGLAAARAKGRVGGRRPKLTTEQWAQIGRLLEAGESRQRIALIFDVGVSTIYRKFPANKSNESP